jgi:hypothetical protein
MKDSNDRIGIEPSTFQLVAQCHRYNNVIRSGLYSPVRRCHCVLIVSGITVQFRGIVVLYHATIRVGSLKISYILRLVVMLNVALRYLLKPELLSDFVISIRRNNL